MGAFHLHELKLVVVSRHDGIETYPCIIICFVGHQPEKYCLYK
jgi:hypothetical protein